MLNLQHLALCGGIVMLCAVWLCDVLETSRSNGAGQLIILLWWLAD